MARERESSPRMWDDIDLSSETEPWASVGSGRPARGRAAPLQDGAADSNGSGAGGRPARGQRSAAAGSGVRDRERREPQQPFAVAPAQRQPGLAHEEGDVAAQAREQIDAIKSVVQNSNELDREMLIELRELEERLMDVNEKFVDPKKDGDSC